MHKTISKTLRYVSFAAVALLLFTACKKDPTTENPTKKPEPTATDSAIESMDAYLRTHYLWNDEYKTLDLTEFKKLAYNEFLESALLSMKTNTLDKKKSGDSYNLYSYIDRKPLAQTAITSRADIARPAHGLTPETADSYGFASMFPIYMDNTGTNVGFGIAAVYPGSPAANAGITRGTIITKINNVEIPASSYLGSFMDLYAPEAGQSVALYDFNTKQTYNLSVAKINENPVIKSEVLTAGEQKIGYLVYSGFDAKYDGELLQAFKKLKDGGATSLILDLRVNGGGHVISANMMSGCIAGSLVQNSVFQYYRYNDSRMATASATALETGNSYDATKNLFYEKYRYPTYYGVDLSGSALGLNKLYCIVSASTASASEAVINSLRGSGVDVVLIGSKTNGKNVGMEPYNFKDTSYEYEFAPITFQSYNKLEQSVDPTGVTVTEAVDDWGGSKTFVDFSATDVCVAKAISLITGTPAPAVQATRTQAGDLQRTELVPNPRAAAGNIAIRPVE